METSDQELRAIEGCLVDPAERRPGRTYERVQEVLAELRTLHGQRDAALERLAANQARLEVAIRARDGYADFSGTPESAVGVAAEMLEGRR